MFFSEQDIQEFLENPKAYNLVDKWTLPDGTLSNVSMHNFHSALQLHYKKPRESRYAYWITFTQDPNKPHFNDIDYIEKRILKILGGKQANAKYCAYVREGGDVEEKHIHWHVLLESHSFVKKYDIMRNYIKNIGGIHFETKFCYDFTKTLIYMSKQCSFKILFDGVFEDYLTKNPTTMRCDKYIHLSDMPHVDFPKP